MTQNTVERSLLILLVQEDPAESASTRVAIEQDMGTACRCQSVERLTTALARVAGGDVDLVLVDLSHGAQSGGGTLDDFLTLRREAPQTPIVVLCNAQDEGLALKAMRAGAADYVIKEISGDSLGRAIRTAIELSPNTADSHSAGQVMAIMGAKGGTGATTVALNVAAALAQQRNKVTLVEMQSAFGALSAYFRPAKLTRNLSQLLELAAAGPAEAEACLWPCEKIAGLSVLFGPQSAAQCRPLAADQIPGVLRALAAKADFVVVDLPASLSEANRAVIENSGVLAVVVERDPVSVQMAAQMRHALESWNAPEPVGMIVVSRAPLRFPMSLAEIDSRLGGPALGVIPAEPDLCQSAQNSSTPLVTFVPESNLAVSLVALAHRLATGRQQLAGAV
jgi:pilus assembly protein CpaE